MKQKIEVNLWSFGFGVLVGEIGTYMLISIIEWSFSFWNFVLRLVGSFVFCIILAIIIKKVVEME